MFCLSAKYVRYGYDKVSKRHFIVLILIFYYVLLCGLRYDVGVDYMAYLSEYEWVKRYVTYDTDHFEPGWAWFTWVLSRNDVHFTVYFGIIAFVQIILLIGAFKNYPKLFPYLILAFFLGGYFINFQNVIRQNIVMCVFLFLVMRKYNANILVYALVTFLCFVIHKSSIIIFACYPVIRYFRFDIERKSLLAGIFLFCVFIGYSFDLFSIVASNIGVLQIIAGTEYSGYLSGNYLSMGTHNTMGVGFFLGVMVDLWLILTGKNVYNKLNNDDNYLVWYRLFYIGTCLQYLFPTSMVLGRPILYLTFFTIPILASFIYYIANDVRRSSLLYIGNMGVFAVLTLLFLVDHIIAPIGNMAEYHFWWEFY